jgi:putative ABC transport system permease protein
MGNHRYNAGPMWKNYLAAALRNVARNRLYTAVNIGGLTIGFAAALLIALYSADQLGYDRFVPGHESVYRIASEVQPAAGAPIRFDLVNANLAAALKSSVGGVESVARLKSTPMSVRHGDREYVESLFWADPSLFDVLPLKGISGDPRGSLDAPGSVVITRRLAQKYFGRADVVGQTLEIRRRQTLRISAVIADLPPNTHLNAEIIASGRASFSALTIFDARPPSSREARAEVYTYFRVNPRVSRSDLEDAVRNFGPRFLHDTVAGTYSMRAVPLTDIHFAPTGLGAMKPADDLNAVRTLGLIGVLIVLMATVNFVNLMTARSAQRAREVGVRKVSGAGRRQLIIQFLGESLVYVIVSALLATSLVELLLPHFSAFLGREIESRYWQQPVFAAAILGATLVIGVLAGTYPAYLISRFQPAAVLYGKTAGPPGGALLRKTLTLLQYSVLVGLAIVALVMYRQTRFALDERLHVPTDQVAMIRTSCSDPLRNQLRNLPGVTTAACSGYSLQNWSIVSAPFRRPGDPDADVHLRLTAIDEGLLELFSLSPLAGRFPSRERVGDTYPGRPPTSGFSNDFAFAEPEPAPVPAVINETTLRLLHFKSPQAALGQALRMNGEVGNAGFIIIGVSPDLPIDSVLEPVQPTVYYLAPTQFGLMYLKLRGDKLPTTLATIADIWKKSGDPRPLELSFLDRYVADLHQDITRQARVLGALTCMALVVACLGLLGLAAYSATQRTREMGIRKALGADEKAIARLMLWDLVRPLLWATVLAWPLAFYFMDRWLEGFSYRIDLSPWMFLGPSAIALAIAVITVFPQVLHICRSRAAEALRYS